MVKIILVIEGGQSGFHADISEKSLQNNIRLQEGFYELLRKEISEFDLYDYVSIVMGGGWKEAKKFYNTTKTNNSDVLLLIDSDVPDNQKEAKRIERKFEPKEAIFFMVQEMEAWFLSQPKILDNYYGEKEDSIGNKITQNPKDYNKPSDELNEILKAHYPENRRQKIYKKMRDDAELVQLLNLSKLKEDFDDVQRLINTLQTKIATDA